MKASNDNPYRGIIPTIIFLTVPQIILTIIFYYVINNYQSKYGFEINWSSAKFGGCAVGFFIHCSCLINGFFYAPFSVVVKRIKEFFYDLQISPRLAFKWYWESMKLDGVYFLILIAIVGANLWIMIDSLLTFINLYGWNL